MSFSARRHDTYLTTYLAVEKNKFGYYICEGCHARKGVDLQKAKISSPIAQNPRVLKTGGYHYVPISSIDSDDVLG
jgi:hypothetical protein